MWLGIFGVRRLEFQEEGAPVVTLVGEPTPWADSALKEVVTVFDGLPDLLTNLTRGVVGVSARLLGVML